MHFVPLFRFVYLNLDVVTVELMRIKLNLKIKIYKKNHKNRKIEMCKIVYICNTRTNHNFTIECVLPMSRDRTSKIEKISA